MEGGYMLGKIVLGVCMIGLIVGMFYGIYMAILSIFTGTKSFLSNTYG